MLCNAKKIFSKFSYLSESYITSRVDIFKTLIFLAREVCNSLITDYFVASAIDGILIWNEEKILTSNQKLMWRN